MKDLSRYVAFFRNMNLGQARSKSPTSDQLLTAFAAAGATAARNFQTNGTVIFAAADPLDAVVHVRRQLEALTGYADTALVRSAEWVLDLVARLDPEWRSAEVVLFDATSAPALRVPWHEPESGGFTVAELDRDHAVITRMEGDVRAVRESHLFLARLVEVPMTGRAVATMLRLSQRLKS